MTTCGTFGDQYCFFIRCDEEEDDVKSLGSNMSHLSQKSARSYHTVFPPSANPVLTNVDWKQQADEVYYFNQVQMKILTPEMFFTDTPYTLNDCLVYLQNQVTLAKQLNLMKPKKRQKRN
jgi:hypothetical protein